MTGGPRRVGAGVLTRGAVASAVAVPIILLLALLSGSASAPRGAIVSPDHEGATAYTNHACLVGSHGPAARHRTSPAACGIDLPPVVPAPLIAIVVLVLLAAGRVDRWLAGHVLPLLAARAPPAVPV